MLGHKSKLCPSKAPGATSSRTAMQFEPTRVAECVYDSCSKFTSSSFLLCHSIVCVQRGHDVGMCKDDVGMCRGTHEAQQHAWLVHASRYEQECRLTVGSPSTSERLPDLGGLKPYLCLTFIFCFRIASKAISMASLLLPWALNSCRSPQVCFVQ